MRDDDETDALASALADHARADREADPRWQALAEGRASAAEADALAREDPARFERYRPFEDADDDALLAGALGALAGRSSGVADDDPQPQRPPTDGADEVAGPLARVIRPARWRRAVYVIAPLALAAGLAFIVLRPGGSSPALPSYRLVDTSGDRATRSEEAARVVTPDARLRWILRPANPVQPIVDARAFVVDGDRRIPLKLEFEGAPGGALRADAPVGEALPDRTGPVSLLIVIGPDATLDRLDPNALDLADLPIDVRVVKHRLDIQPR